MAGGVIPTFPAPLAASGEIATAAAAAEATDMLAASATSCLDTESGAAVACSAVLLHLPVAQWAVPSAGQEQSGQLAQLSRTAG